MTTLAGRFNPAGILNLRGDALLGSEVAVYEQGTAVLANLYTDKTKADPAPNPFTATTGEAVFWTDPGDKVLVATYEGVERTWEVTVPLHPDEPGGGGGASELDDLTDVDLTGQDDGEFLQRESGVWVPRSIPSDAAAGTASLRTLGTGATQAAAGNHTHTAYAAAGAGLGFGFPCNFIPQLSDPAAAIALVANWCLYSRLISGGGAITKIGLEIGTSSGNISVAHLTGPSGRTGPDARVATSGAVPCPASGFAEVALGSSTTPKAGDWFGISADNTTATAQMSAGPAGAGSALGAGGHHFQASAHPVPATPSVSGTTGARRQRMTSMVGVT